MRCFMVLHQHRRCEYATCAPRHGRTAAVALQLPMQHWHEILWRKLSRLPQPSSAVTRVPICVPRGLHVQAVRQSINCCALLTIFIVQAMTPQSGSFGQHLLKGFAALWNDRWVRKWTDQMSASM